MIAKSVPSYPRPGLPSLYSPAARLPVPPSPGIEIGRTGVPPLRLEGRPGQKSFRALFEAESMTRLDALKRGLPASFLDEVARELAFTWQALARALGLSVSTLARKRASHKPMTPPEGERLLGLARLIGQVEVLVYESGDPEGFHAARWMRAWLDQEVPALGGRRPRDLLDTMEGQGLISRALSSLQSGACF